MKKGTKVRYEDYDYFVLESFPCEERKEDLLVLGGALHVNYAHESDVEVVGEATERDLLLDICLSLKSLREEVMSVSEKANDDDDDDDDDWDDDDEPDCENCEYRDECDKECGEQETKNKKAN